MGKWLDNVGGHNTVETDDTLHHGNDFPAIIPGDKGTRLYESFVDLLHHGMKDYGSYVIPKKRAGLPAMPDFEDKIKDSPLIEEAFHRDVAWVFCGAHVKLQDIRSKQERAWNDLLVNGFGGSVSGKPYLTNT
eukprot:gene917-10673_t